MHNPLKTSLKKGCLFLLYTYMTSLHEHIEELYRLNESILNQEDSLNGVDRFVLQDWMDKYVISKPKVQFLKDGSIKVNGDFIIKGFDGEVFPSALRIASIINGDITIEKCPNIESIGNIFAGIKNQVFGGDISVGNCDNLNTLNGLPFMTSKNVKIVGNRKLKTLAGIPISRGNVYVMKNGKKFTEEDVRTALGDDSKIAKKIIV